MDDKRCYWLDPSDASVQSFLASIALELQDLGFDEVLFDQFYFPSSDAINWSSDLGLTRQTAVQNAAEGIRAALEGSSIRVDFVSERSRCRRAGRPHCRCERGCRRSRIHSRRLCRRADRSVLAAALPHQLPRYPL